MSEVIISVRGRNDIHHSAERATARLSVGFEGPSRDDVTAWTSQAHERVVADVRAMHDPAGGPITWWSSESIRIWSTRPWNQDGKQLPLVHHAAVEVTAKFSDFQTLGRWLPEVGITPGVSVVGVDWALTEARKLEVSVSARMDAVRDAARKASDYAAALGLETLRPVAVADPGMLGDGAAHSGERGAVQYSRTMAPGVGSGELGVELKPEDITVSVEIDARFAAS